MGSEMCIRDRFIESEAIPPDGTKVREVLEKSNKDGSRDKRYAENRQLQVMEYGEITFSSGSGIYEKYMFSDAKRAENFLIPYRHSRILFRGL